MSEIPKTPEWAELFDLLKRLERPPGSRTPLPPTLTAAVSSGDLGMVELFLACGSAREDHGIVVAPGGGRDRGPATWTKPPGRYSGHGVPK